MRKLTLDEKISIRGALGIRKIRIPKLEMKGALDTYYRNTGKHLLYLNTTKRAYDKFNNDYPKVVKIDKLNNKFQEP